jgi:hypothetical protein
LQWALNRLQGFFWNLYGSQTSKLAIFIIYFNIKRLTVYEFNGEWLMFNSYIDGISFIFKQRRRLIFLHFDN